MSILGGYKAPDDCEHEGGLVELWDGQENLVHWCAACGALLFTGATTEWLLPGSPEAAEVAE